MTPELEKDAKKHWALHMGYYAPIRKKAVTQEVLTSSLDSNKHS